MASGAGRIARVDVLRGLAALGVFVFHASNVLEFPKRVMPPFDLGGWRVDGLPSPFSLGATGVNLFFVVSGFCLALQPLRRAAKAIEPGRYYRDRAARIYPAYALAVLFSAAVATWLGIAWRGAELGTFLLFAQGFVQPWVFSFNGALWSMATEVQFYLVFPLLYAAQVRLGPARFVALAGMVTLAWRAGAALTPGADEVIGGITQSAFRMNLLPGRLLEFALGMAVAERLLHDRDRLRTLARRSLLPALAFGIGLRGLGPAWLADPAMGLAYATLLAASVAALRPARDDGLAARFGRASYSFFLIHFPVLVLLLHLLGGPGALARLGPYGALAVLSCAGLLATLALSSALYLGVELPAWRWLGGPRRTSGPVPASDP
jgi:peptidoglycan/LPS O-acetylase OafA/YrhL